jgi:multiple sugar transport system permease protein
MYIIGCIGLLYLPNEYISKTTQKIGLWTMIIHKGINIILYNILTLINPENTLYILFKNNFDGISNALIESAELDGCGNFRIFWNIVLPIAAPVVFYVAIGALSVAWADYFTPYLVIKDVNLQPTPARLFLLKSDLTVPTNLYMMGLIFACIPPFIIYVLFQRKIMGGMMAGAVKG